MLDLGNTNKHAIAVYNQINIEIERWQSEYTRSFLSEIREFFDRPAKYVRPILLATLCEELGGELELAYATGSAIEIYHAATLLYDDIQDNSEFRRGMASLHVSTSTSFALSIAGVTRTLMYHPVNRCHGFSAIQRDIVRRVLDNTCTLVTLGQAIESTWVYQKRWDISTSEYVEMIKRKTATLFAASCQLGALLGCGNNSVLPRELREIGFELGVCFQLRNDLLDVLGHLSTTGRPPYDDIREGKRTLLILYALEELKPRERTHLVDSLDHGKLDENEVQVCVDLIRSTSSIHRVVGEITDRLDRLQANLCVLPSYRLQELFLDMIHHLEISDV